MKRDEIKIVFTDLDRTLLRDDNTLSAKNLAALQDLREKGVVTVIATGRNILSAKRVLSENLPFDYLMFSSGCGIMDWQGKEVIFENHLNENEVTKATQVLVNYKVDFMLHDLIPENHRFQYWKVSLNNPDFERRICLYKDFVKSLQLPVQPQKASQLLVVLPAGSDSKFNEIQKELDFVKVIRTTSPLDHSSIWLEIFPKGVSKGHSAQWLCEHLSYSQEETLSIGNDFNDIDLLNWTAQSYVVENAPKELKQKYQTTSSNEEDGFAEVVVCILKL
ncbi:MAG: HAD hydrolase family protein [Candidatus Cloacimonetes bacterium]|nr:HAD hydrolase family protein [Candidatus Cloacimonadota bacterium]